MHKNICICPLFLSTRYVLFLQQVIYQKSLFFLKFLSNFMTKNACFSLPFIAKLQTIYKIGITFLWCCLIMLKKTVIQFCLLVTVFRVLFIYFMLLFNKLFLHFWAAKATFAVLLFLYQPCVSLKQHFLRFYCTT